MGLSKEPNFGIFTSLSLIFLNGNYSLFGMLVVLGEIRYVICDLVKMNSFNILIICEPRVKFSP
jgi:hypothetical protein